tara:strand:- start:458 stop:895 length:438 start_codon:yes stop_codon:yes gene_type:complete
VSDSRFRELERRWKETGSVEDEVAWWQERARLEPVEARGSVLVRLRLSGSEEGGRNQPISSGYRPNWDIGNRHDDGTPTINCGVVVLEDSELLSPGDAGLAWLIPLVPRLWAAVHVGQELALHEGRLPIGHATVLLLCDDPRANE